MLAKLAVRNLLQHRSKSLIVGALMALGVALLVVGNSIMVSLDNKMEASFTHEYSGDLFIYPDKKAIELQTKKPSINRKKQTADANRSGPQGAESNADEQDNTNIFRSFGSGKKTVLPDYTINRDDLLALPYIDQISPQTVGMGRIENGLGAQTVSLFWGVDPDAWQQLGFSQYLTWHTGNFWANYEQGIAINRQVADAYQQSSGQTLKVGDEIQVSVSGDAGTKIRSLVVSGIFSFHSNAAPQLNIMSLVNLSSSQALFSLTTDTDSASQLTAADEALITNVSDDSLFANQLFVASTDLVIDANQLEAELSSSLARHRSQTQNAPHEFHFIAVQLSKGEDTLQAQTLLQTWIQENGLLWKVGDWQQAAGFVAAMASSIGWILNGAMVLIGVIAIIIIMNTLVISVTERLTEIGTMRAIGAQKSLVRRLIILETLVLSVSASVVGVIIGALTIGLLHWLGLNPPGDFFALLLGGQALHPTLAIQETFNAVLMMVLAALIASYYPLTIALKVNPVVAMEG